MADATRPFPCTKCGQQVWISEEAITWIDFGPAVIGADRIVQAPESSTVGSVSDPNPHRTYAICRNPDCGHRWLLRRRFDGGTP